MHLQLRITQPNYDLRDIRQIVLNGLHRRFKSQEDMESRIEVYLLEIARENHLRFESYTNEYTLTAIS